MAAKPQGLFGSSQISSAAFDRVSSECINEMYTQKKTKNIGEILYLITKSAVFRGPSAYDVLFPSFFDHIHLNPGFFIICAVDDPIDRDEVIGMQVENTLFSCLRFTHE